MRWPAWGLCVNQFTCTIELCAWLNCECAPSYHGNVLCALDSGRIPALLNIQTMQADALPKSTWMVFGLFLTTVKRLLNTVSLLNYCRFIWMTGRRLRDFMSHGGVRFAASTKRRLDIWCPNMSVLVTMCYVWALPHNNLRYPCNDPPVCFSSFHLLANAWPYLLDIAQNSLVGAVDVCDSTNYAIADFLLMRI